jgi:hypothetical protein
MSGKARQFFAGIGLTGSLEMYSLTCPKFIDIIPTFFQDFSY